jgi:RNA polymerase sigma-70 factor, ECF subfamily
MGHPVTDVTTRGHPDSVTSPGVLAATAPQTRPSLRPIEVCLPPASAEVRARSFRALYEEHVDFVWRNLRRLGVYDADVDDRTQEVFVVAHKRFDQFEDRGHGPRAWLFQIVLRVASDARRHRRRHPEDPDGGDALGRTAVEAPQAALETIEVGRRAVLVLHEIEEMTAPEIAQVLGIPLNTVYSRLRVGRAELESALTARGRGEEGP